MLALCKHSSERVTPVCRKGCVSPAYLVCGGFAENRTLAAAAAAACGLAGNPASAAAALPSQPVVARVPGRAPRHQFLCELSRDTGALARARPVQPVLPPRGAYRAH